MDSQYYRINQKKKLVLFDTTSFAKMKSTLFYELSKTNESSAYHQIRRLFQSFLKDYLNKYNDRIFIIKALIEDYKAKHNIQLENYDSVSINICKKIAEKEYKMCLDFDKDNINDFCVLLSVGFTKLFTTNKKKFKQYEALKAEIEEYRKIFIDFKKIYKSYNYSLPPITPEIPKNTLPNDMLLLMDILQGIKKIHLSLDNYDKESMMPYLIILLNFDWLFPFVFEIELDLSNEKLASEIEKLYYLREKSIYLKNKKNDYVVGVKNLEKYDPELSNLDNLNLIKKGFKCNEKIKNFVLNDKPIASNIAPNPNINNNNNNSNNFNNKNININNNTTNVNKTPIPTNNTKNFNPNSNVNIANSINSNNNNANINREMVRTENIPQIKIVKNKTEEKYINILKENLVTFDIVLCYYYLMKEVKYLKSISIIVPNGFAKENADILKLKNIPDMNLSNPNVFEYMTIITSLNSLNMIFNGLEKKTFENVLYLFQNNLNLKELNLKLFPDDNKQFKSENLIQIAEECGILNRLLTANPKNDKNYLPFLSGNEKIIKQKLLEMFSVNLEKLFLLMHTKKNLEKIEFIINLPLILYDNEGYHWTIMKFLLNIFLLLQKEKYNLKEFKFILPYFNMDNRQFPIISEFLEKINLNEKNKLLKHFHFHASLIQVQNIKNIIPYSLVSLNLGEIDLSTFNALVDFYQSEEFLEKSPLKYLRLELNRIITRYKECKKDLNKFFSGKNPKTLKELTLKCYFCIKRKDLYDLLINCNGNRIERYNFIMKTDNIKKYNKIINHKDFYYMNDDIEQKMKTYFTMLKRSGFICEENKNIAKRIIKCLVASNGKTINVLNEE